MVKNFPTRIKSLRARFLAWALETALGFMMFVVVFGTVAAPLFLGVSTAGWDPYAAMLWGFMMMVCIIAFMIRVINSAKAGYQPVF
jgi:fatty-acid desaturase